MPTTLDVEATALERLVAESLREERRRSDPDGTWVAELDRIVMSKRKACLCRRKLGRGGTMRRVQTLLAMMTTSRPTHLCLAV